MPCMGLRLRGKTDPITHNMKGGDEGWLLMEKAGVGGRGINAAPQGHQNFLVDHTFCGGKLGYGVNKSPAPLWEEVVVSSMNCER